jgi:hypothetical protein
MMEQNPFGRKRRVFFANDEWEYEIMAKKC